MYEPRGRVEDGLVHLAHGHPHDVQWRAKPRDYWHLYEEMGSAIRARDADLGPVRTQRLPNLC